MALTPAQLVARQSRIGGSDAPCVLGIGHATAYEVGMRILGQMPPNTALDDADHILIGNEMEGVLASVFMKKHPTMTLFTPETIVHPRYPHVAANIDRRVLGHPEIGVECKNTGLHVNDTWGKPGTDEVPKRVLLQVQHCMACDADLEMFYVLRCYGGNTYQEFAVPRNNELIEALLTLENAFYANLQNGVLPEPDWAHASTAGAVKRAFQKIQGTVEQRDDLTHWTACFEEASAARLEAEKLEAAIKNRINVMMGDAEIALLPDGKRWRRKLIKKAEYTAPATTYIETRLVKPRKGSDGNADG